MNLDMRHRTTEAVINIIELQAYFHPEVVKAAKMEWNRRKNKRNIKNNVKKFGSN